MSSYILKCKKTINGHTECSKPWLILFTKINSKKSLNFWVSIFKIILVKQCKDNRQFENKSIKYHT